MSGMTLPQFLAMAEKFKKLSVEGAQFLLDSGRIDDLVASGGNPQLSRTLFRKGLNLPYMLPDPKLRELGPCTVTESATIGSLLDASPIVQGGMGPDPMQIRGSSGVTRRGERSLSLATFGERVGMTELLAKLPRMLQFWEFASLEYMLALACESCLMHLLESGSILCVGSPLYRESQPRYIVIELYDNHTTPPFPSIKIWDFDLDENMQLLLMDKP